MAAPITLFFLTACVGREALLETDLDLDAFGPETQATATPAGVDAREGGVRPDRLDVEAIFQLALPLIALPTELSGCCRLDVQLGHDETPAIVGVTARVEGGRVASCEGRLDQQAETWMS
jgi:hypothetical protein